MSCNTRPWTIRGSSTGYMYLCSLRAALTRAAHTGELMDEEDAGELERLTEYTTSPPADLGTVEHWLTQDALKATFPPGDHQYSEEQLANAATLFNGDEKLCLQHAAVAAGRAARAARKITKHRKFLAEVEVEDEFGIGHVDLITETEDWLIDLKFVSRKPRAPNIVHEYQLFRYGRAKGIENVALIYVDSRQGLWSEEWAYDLSTQEAGEVLADIVCRLDWLTSAPAAEVYQQATRTPGPACDWCPFFETEFCLPRLRPTSHTGTESHESTTKMPASFLHQFTRKDAS